ncbi:MAG TPA: flagellar hook-basal body complex protein FliE [Alphaproteobacteria bacterium]|nr:flagellar hook-basal body complex protein FliE [Alphaproteobacteria bacterium]
MVANVTNAINAYKAASRAASGQGLDPRPVGKSFSDMLGEAANAAVGDGVKAEKLSAAALLGKADYTQVITAVAKADVALQTVVTIRDKIIGAYQDILKMPM